MLLVGRVGKARFYFIITINSVEEKNLYDKNICLFKAFLNMNILIYYLTNKAWGLIKIASMPVAISWLENMDRKIKRYLVSVADKRRCSHNVINTFVSSPQFCSFLTTSLRKLEYHENYLVLEIMSSVCFFMTKLNSWLK